MGKLRQQHAERVPDLETKDADKNNKGVGEMGTAQTFFAPSAGEAVTIASDRNAYKALLDKEWYARSVSKRERSIAGHTVAYVDAMADVGGGHMSLASLPVFKASTLAGSMALDRDTIMPISGPQPNVLIGPANVKLNNLKSTFEREGLEPRFHDGGLVCREGVSVRKGDGGHADLVIEGPLCPEYFQVRDLLYSRFTVL